MLMLSRTNVIIVTAFCFFLSGCLNDKSKDPVPEETCTLERFIYHDGAAVDSSFLLHYNDLGQLEQMENQYSSGSSWITKVAYKHTYKTDTIKITTFPQGTLLLTCLLDGTRLKEIKKFTNTPGYFYRYKFDYSEVNEVMITLEYGSALSTQYLEHGVYSLDAIGNISELKIYRTPYPTIVAQDKVYTYDPSRNPLKGLILPFFNNQAVPDVSYFSASNKTKEQYTGVTNTFSYQYGENLMPTQCTLPNGMVQKYSYTCTTQ
jgi:hypothetical protein